MAALGALVLTLAACGTPSALSVRSLSASPGRPAPAGATGVTTAAARLQDAAGAMTRAPDFTLAGTVSAGGSTTQLAGQFQSPDIVELTVTPTTGTPITVLFVGATSYVKAPDGTWTNHLTGAAGPADPRVAFAVLDKATDVTSTTSAAGSTSYAFSLPRAAAASIVQGGGTDGPTTLTGTAVVTSGTISELTLGSTTSSTTFRADLHYSAVGTTTPVALPPGV